MLPLLSMHPRSPNASHSLLSRASPQLLSYFIKNVYFLSISNDGFTISASLLFDHGDNGVVIPLNIVDLLLIGYHKVLSKLAHFGEFYLNPSTGFTSILIVLVVFRWYMSPRHLV